MHQCCTAISIILETRFDSRGLAKFGSSSRRVEARTCASVSSPRIRYLQRAFPRPSKRHAGSQIMLGQRLLLHSPAFLLLAVTNLAVLLWSLRSHPSTDSAGSALDLPDNSLNATTSLHRSRLRRPSGDETHRQASARTDTELAAGDSGTRSCEVCVSDPGNELCQEYGLDNVRLSRAYEGSGHRVRRVMEKALRGEKVKIG